MHKNRFSVLGSWFSRKPNTEHREPNTKRGIALYSILLIISGIFMTGFNPLKGVKKSQLKNGLTLIVKENHTLPLVSLQIWVRVGSINETPSENGISHFLEHMLFKGTTNYSTGEITRLIESNGGVTNAATGKEFTHYYIDIPSENFPLALKILTEVSLESVFPEDEIERERLVILEEVKRRNDNPDALLWDKFDSQLFTQTSYHYPIIGSTTTIKGITRAKLLDYYYRYYVPNNMVLVVVGNVKYEQVVDLAKKYFAVFSAAKLPPMPDLIEPKKAPFSVSLKLPVKQARLLLGILGPTIDSPDQVALDVLAVYLAGGRSFSFYRILREEKKLVYAIDASFITQKGTGFFLIGAEGEAKKIEESRKEIKKIIAETIQGKIDHKQLTRAKELIKSGWLFSYETNDGQAGQLGYFAAVNKWTMLRNYLSLVEKISVQDLRNVLKTYFVGQEFSSLIAYPEE